MGRRLAVHARSTRRPALGRTGTRGARGATRCILLGGVVAFAVLSASANPVVAAPKHKTAKAAFQRGVAAYQKQRYQAAADALGESYDLEPDLETLYAWAQAERQLDDCEKASELYRKLLGYQMPAENKQVIRDKIEECRTLLAAQEPDVRVEPDPEPAPPARGDSTGDGDGRGDPDAARDGHRAASPQRERERDRDDSHRSRTSSPWYADATGDALLGGGVIALGLGSAFLISASTAAADAQLSYPEFATKTELARSRGEIGVVALVASGVLVTGAIVRYLVHGQSQHPPAPRDRALSSSAWITPGGGGGVAILGRF